MMLSCFLVVVFFSFGISACFFSCITMQVNYHQYRIMTIARIALCSYPAHSLLLAQNHLQVAVLNEGKGA
jgi:hypothetical protein